MQPVLSEIKPGEEIYRDILTALGLSEKDSVSGEKRVLFVGRNRWDIIVEVTFCSGFHVFSHACSFR